MSGENLPKFHASPLLHLSSEAEFQDTVIEMASYLGYRSWHDTDSRKNDPGFPDLVLVGVKNPKQMVYLECKRLPKGESRSEKEKTSPTVDQVQWIQDIRATGVHAYVVNPSNMDFIESVLRGYEPIPDPLSPIVSEALARVLKNEAEPVERRRAPRRKGNRRRSS